MRGGLRLLPELIGFAVLLVAAKLEAWTPGELAWGLWASGFLMVMLWLPLLLLLLLRQDGFRLVRVPGLLLAAGVTAWGFIWLYRFYGEMLDLAFPLLPDPGRVYVGGATWRHVRPFELWPTLVAAVREVYLAVIVSLLPLIPGLHRSWNDPDGFRRNPGFRGGAFARLHFTVMALAALQIVLRDQPSGHAFLFSAAILTINYFPWHALAAPSGTDAATDHDGVVR